MHLPKDKENNFKGFCFVTFSTAEEAMHCFSELDNKIVFGRILHLKPAFENAVLKQI